MRAPWRPESSAHLIGVWRGAWCAMVVDDAMSCFVMLAGDVHAAAAVRQTQWPEVRVPLNFYNAPLSGPPLSCAPISSPPLFLGGHPYVHDAIRCSPRVAMTTPSLRFGTRRADEGEVRR